MANIKSAKKRILVSAKRQARNKHVNSQTKTAVKKVMSAAAAGERETAKAAFIHAVSAIDKAASKGIYHKNTAARKKSKLAKMMNKAAL